MAGFESLNDKGTRSILYALWPLLFFIFAGILVGENICEALLITHFSYSVLPKMYAVNSLGLFILLPLFFFFIDRVQRDKMLLRFIKITIIGVLIFRFVFFLYDHYFFYYQSILSVTIFTLYIFSYITKIMLLIIFWTLANDVSNTRQSRNVFPLVASGGLIGGVAGSFFGNYLLNYFAVPQLLFLWAGLLIPGIPILKKIEKSLSFVLQQSEYGKRFGGDAVFNAEYLKTVSGDQLIRIMGVLYFIVFLIIFNFDFQFAKSLNLEYRTPETFAAFRYKFYYIHCLAAVLVQWFVVGFIVKRFGVVTTLFVLPIYFVLAFGFWMFNISYRNESMGFMVIVGLQFFRQLLFESFFSPHYQVFFSSLRQEVRGRAKVLLEGFVKPGAILFSGVFIYILQDRESYLFLILFIFSILFGFVLWALRKQYLKSLLAGVIGEGPKIEIIHEMSAAKKERIKTVLKDGLQSNDMDIKRVAVAGLSADISKETFRLLYEQYWKDRDEGREFIIKYMGPYNYPENMKFLISETESQNYRLSANAFYALRHSPYCHIPEVIKKAKENLEHNEIRVRIEAARILWQQKDVKTWDIIEKKVENWMESGDEKTVSGAIFLMGKLQNRLWIPKIWKGLNSESDLIWKQTVKALSSFNSPEAWILLLKHMGKVTRKREETLVHALGRMPEQSWSIVLDAIMETSKKREIYLLIEVLKRIAFRTDVKMIQLSESIRKKIKSQILRDLKEIYKEVCACAEIMKTYDGAKTLLLRDAMREKIKRMTYFLFNMISLLDKTAQLIKVGSRYISEKDPLIKGRLMEMLDSVGERDIINLFIPLMEVEDLDSLKEVGIKNWKQNRYIKGQHERTMIESNNNWICSVCIYVLSGNKNEESVNELIRKRKNDPSSLVAGSVSDYFKDMNYNTL